MFRSSGLGPRAWRRARDAGAPSGKKRGQVYPSLLLIAAITTGALLAPLTVHLSGLLVAAPTLTGTRARTRLTAVIALITTAAVVVIDRHDGLLHSPLLPIHIGAVLTVSVFVLATAALHQRDQKELARVRAVSEAAQRVLLRPLPQELGPFRVASTYRTATTQALVGGDLYASSRAGEITRILIGDVRGKGLPAVEDASVVLDAFRESTHQQRTLPGLAASLERSVRWHLGELADEGDPQSAERFITVLLIELADEEEIVRAVSCGHPPPLLRHHSQVTPLRMIRPAPPLGLAGDTPDAFNLEVAAFECGDTLLLYTDGLSEARNAAGDFFPVLDRATTWTWDSPGRLLQYVSSDVGTYAGLQLRDDLAIVAIQRTLRFGDAR
ncbi:PP2C family protein-serine/threonine phosphatase [Streptomyces sp. NPDC046977]|uniref:PP2C family protein-serine/threonine phosphatase n=1 Tax=Streptomyces sp. NPDC046977 TaxID=3154703 RepID=UPI0033DCB235